MYNIKQHLKINIIVALLFLISSITNAQTFDDKTIDAGSPLSVKLISFSAVGLNNDVIVSWKTATETNNSHFIIERSANGTNFVNIGTVAGNGNAVTVNNYRFTDVNPEKINLYYRLQQVDFAGNIVYSTIVLVKINKSYQASLSIYPSIVKTKEVNINTNNIAFDAYTLFVKSTNGKSIMQQVKNITANNQVFQVTLPQTIAAGVYIIQLINTSGTVNLTQKIIVQ